MSHLVGVVKHKFEVYVSLHHVEEQCILGCMPACWCFLCVCCCTLVACCCANTAVYCMPVLLLHVVVAWCVSSATCREYVYRMLL